MGATGPQKLDRQNRTLANSTKSGATLHLFEVFEKSRYIYAGEFELAGEPYMSDQPDKRADGRFVWIFPLRRKAETKSAEAAPDDQDGSDHLPHAAYAVIGSGLAFVKVVETVLNYILDWRHKFHYARERGRSKRANR